jgi:hypothetical protein
MIYRLLLQLALCRTVLSLSLSSTLKECQRHVLGSVSTVAAATTLCLPVSAHAVEVIKIDADIPALIQIAKDNKDVVLKLAQQTAGVVKITDYPKSYSNVLNFVRDVAAGDVFVEINGIPIDVSLLSEKGAIDVDLFTEVGDISVTVSSDILPKLPFLSKRVVPLSKAPPVDTTSNSDSVVTVETITKPPVRTRAAAAIQAANNEKGSMFDRIFMFDPFQQGWTVKQVLGTTSLGLGIAYASSYAYYVRSIEEEELAAAEKKKNAAAKKKAVADVEKKVVTKSAPKAEVMKVESPSAMEVKNEATTVSTEARKVSTAPVTTKESEPKPMATTSTTLSSDVSSEQPKKSRRFLRFWKSED